MANELRLAMALEHYDRHMPFIDGSLRPNGLDIQVQFVTQEARPVGDKNVCWQTESGTPVNCRWALTSWLRPAMQN